MKIVLTEAEVKSMLVQHVNETFPGVEMNTVEFDLGYSTFRGAELFYVAPQVSSTDARERVNAVLDTQGPTDLKVLAEILDETGRTAA